LPFTQLFLSLVVFGPIAIWMMYDSAFCIGQLNPVSALRALSFNEL
jgi:hypothetical protein